MNATKPLIKYILSVDDDPDDRQMLKEALGALDVPHGILEAQDGEDCLRQLKAMVAENHPPCLVILDINMPKMDGRRTFLAIRNDPAFHHIPVIIFSTSTSPMDRLFFTSKNAAYFVKPVTVQHLLTIVREMLDHCV